MIKKTFSGKRFLDKEISVQKKVMYELVSIRDVAKEAGDRKSVV